MVPDHLEPQPPYSGYSDLHYATEHQVRSALFLAGYDRGELTSSPGRVSFRGMRVSVECPDVTAVNLVRKTFPWGTAVVVGLVSAVMVYLASPAPFTWRQPLPYVVSVILLVAAIRHATERWVEVVSRGESGSGPSRAYFRRQPMFFGSSAARTRELYEELLRIVPPK